AVLFGPSGLAETLGGGQILIEMSTIGPKAFRSVAARLPDGVGAVDAPVRGSVPEATSGRLDRRLRRGPRAGDVGRSRPRRLARRSASARRGRARLLRGGGHDPLDQSVSRGFRDVPERFVEVVVIDWLVGTDGGVVPLILRLTLAVVMFPHGAQKTLGWFGGYGFRNTMASFTKSGFPPALAFLAVMAELLGPLGLAIGLLTRVAALGIAVVMLVAILV